MSGQLRVLPSGTSQRGLTHVHCAWWVKSQAFSGQLIFRDPRRFGGLRTFSSMEDLRQCWAELGPDALTVRADELFAQLHERDRPIKAALLDQTLIAGVGNIYADESLFRAGIHPLMNCSKISRKKYQALVNAIKSVMLAAIESGGSTIRSYMDSDGKGGSFALKHAVYGRAAQPCIRCKAPLKHITAAQRTTVFCGKCQPRRSLHMRTSGS
jgi:formamidopyrimidine-DNA glycosylase